MTVLKLRHGSTTGVGLEATSWDCEFWNLHTVAESTASPLVCHREIIKCLHSSFYFMGSFEKHLFHVIEKSQANLTQVYNSLCCPPGGIRQDCFPPLVLIWRFLLPDLVFIERNNMDKSRRKWVVMFLPNVSISRSNAWRFFVNNREIEKNRKQLLLFLGCTFVHSIWWSTCIFRPPPSGLDFLSFMWLVLRWQVFLVRRPNWFFCIFCRLCMWQNLGRGPV